MLVKFRNEFKEYWDDFLDVFLHTTWQGKLINFVHRLHLYMSLRHESSLFTPFEGMFGRRAIFPVDINGGVPNAPMPSVYDADIEEAVECLTNNRIRIMKEIS